MSAVMESQAAHEPVALTAGRDGAGSVALASARLAAWLRGPRPWLALLGFTLCLAFWHLAVDVWRLPRFSGMPGLVAVVREMFSRDPVYGLSVFMPEYYWHVLASVRRVG